MSEQGKKRQRNYDLLNTETNTTFLCIQNKEKCLQKNYFLMKPESGGLDKK